MPHFKPRYITSTFGCDGLGPPYSRCLMLVPQICPCPMICCLTNHFPGGIPCGLCCLLCSTHTACPALILLPSHATPCSAAHGLPWLILLPSHALQHTACPALLLEILGPHIRVSALSWWGEKASLAPMTPLVHTLLLTHDSQHLMYLARLIDSMRLCIAELNDWYAFMV